MRHPSWYNASAETSFANDDANPLDSWINGIETNPATLLTAPPVASATPAPATSATNTNQSKAAPEQPTSKNSATNAPTKLNIKGGKIAGMSPEVFAGAGLLFLSLVIGGILFSVMHKNTTESATV